VKVTSTYAVEVFLNSKILIWSRSVEHWWFLVETAGSPSVVSNCRQHTRCVL